MIWPPQMTSRDLVLMLGITAVLASAGKAARLSGVGRRCGPTGREIGKFAAGLSVGPRNILSPCALSQKHHRAVQEGGRCSGGVRGPDTLSGPRLLSSLLYNLFGTKIRFARVYCSLVAPQNSRGEFPCPGTIFIST
jgi:hypothetical protein